ncbi:MAG: hypothetical protein WAT93_11250 [Pontixanthobacter sp.]
MAKKPSNRLLRRAIKDIIEPDIAALGFTGKYPEWQRKSGEEYHFIEIYTAKYGGSFGISGAWGTAKDFGQYPPRLPATDFDNRASVMRGIHLWSIDGRPFTHWQSSFDYSLIVSDAEQCQELARETLPGLAALERWFATKEYGDGVDTVSSKIGSAVHPQLLSNIASAKAELGLY